MRRIIVSTLAIAVCCWMAPQGPACAETSGSDARPATIRLAVFDFELDDASAGASLTSAADAEQLKTVTSEVRRLIGQSRRYRLVDVSGADAEAVTKHTLQSCGGCDAAVALKLDAEQSLVGIVTRISRMEYLVAYRLRDARTGAVIATEQTGLRMGADYSWTRGAASLIKDRLLKDQDRP